MKILIAPPSVKIAYIVCFVCVTAFPLTRGNAVFILWFLSFFTMYCCMGDFLLFISYRMIK